MPESTEGVSEGQTTAMSGENHWKEKGCLLEEKHLQNAEDRRLSGMEGGRSFCSKQENTGTEKGAISLINGVSKAEIWLNVQN